MPFYLGFNYSEEDEHLEDCECHACAEARNFEHMQDDSADIYFDDLPKCPVCNHEICQCHEEKDK